ncbi:LysR substrate-binding domain-containing protein [Variovorax sp. NFACC27]|uniref:LysR substrate-binding domain-containing protein n=1 Tax=unclassified Variovorax TaxID=663243 RepID=UPI000898F4F4|nr:DNA-binding transcriptional regulator, LysR family [Variovorax sp. NFACC28]SEF89979.1 DNA-binding transcriptional regulator, LysR family [Variovorax sp. NFACC29]SFB88518.1 DNA-binding transcriptional regulator, LysR family [Variovorax sp. NFACC26]SFF84707.1 DNA-binding transcriptional regulator, LysR family [Variovorax sp. NFACC27]
MEDFNDLALFAHVVEQQGFSAASRHLGIPKSRLSRRVSLLEERIGVRLLQRSSRRLLLTSVGRQFYERCQATVAAGEEAFDVARQATAQPQGLLRVSCPFTLAQFWLTPLIPSFMRTFPGVRLQLEVSNRRVDPLQENIDVVLRVRRPPFEDSSLVARPLGGTVDVLLASPALVERLGMPQSLADLAAWPVLSLPAENERYHWALERGAQSHDFAFTPHFVTDDMFALRHLAEQGMGLALLPEIMCRDALADGRLLRLCGEWACAASEIQAAFASRRGMLPAVRAFIDHLLQNPPGAAEPGAGVS